MSDSEKIHILLATADTHLAHQLVQRIRARFSRLPIEMNWISDGKQARAEFANQNSTLILVSEDLPNLSGPELIQEIRKSDGSVGIIFLKKSASAKIQGVENIDLPIVNWTEFLERIQEAIPDFWKAKFGIFERKSPLFLKLVAYAERYKQPTEIIRNSESIVCIPNLFDTGNADAAVVQMTVQKSGAQAPELQRLSPAQFMRSLKIEVSLVVILTLATLGAVIGKAGGSAESFWNLRSVLVALTGFAYLGFFLGRIFDRFAINKRPG